MRIERRRELANISLVEIGKIERRRRREPNVRRILLLTFVICTDHDFVKTLTYDKVPAYYNYNKRGVLTDVDAALL